MSFTSLKKLFFIVPFSLFLGLTVFISTGWSQDIFKWIDANGIIHLSDYPPDIPPAYRKNVQIIKEYPEPPVEDTTIPFEKTKSGLIVLDTILNKNIRARMIFDTGSDTVVITEKLAKTLNQEITGGGAEVILHTNRGDINATAFTINEVDLGDLSKQDVLTVISPDESYLNGFDGLLGLTFWKDLKITVDYKHSTIRISNEE